MGDRWMDGLGSIFTSFFCLLQGTGLWEGLAGLVSSSYELLTCPMGYEHCSQP
jgi:hypothetical protein